MVTILVFASGRKGGSTTIPANDPILDGIALLIGDEVAVIDGEVKFNVQINLDTQSVPIVAGQRIAAVVMGFLPNLSLNAVSTLAFNSQIVSEKDATTLTAEETAQLLTDPDVEIIGRRIEVPEVP